MAQLDTRGFVSGAAQGFGLAQDYIDTERRRDREDQLMEWEVADRDTRAQDRRRTIGIQDEQMDWQRENQNFQRRQNNWAEFQQDFQPIMANLQTRGELTDEEWSIVGQGVKNFPGRLPSDLSDMWRSRQAQTILPTIQQLMTDPDSVTPEQIDNLENMPVPLHHAIEPEQGEALAVVGDLMDPETPTNMRSPQVIDAANRIFGPRLGEGKRIVSMMPGREPGTLVFELEVTGEDGNTRTAPMTRNRGTVEDDDNEVLQVPVEQLMGELQDAMAIKATFDQNPAAAQRVMQHAISQGYITQPKREDTFEIVELPNGRFGQINSRTGELVKELSAEEAAKANGPGGSGGGVEDNDARLWYKDINTSLANQFGLQVDEFGTIVGEGGPGLETATAYSDLAAQLWRKNRANGEIISPQEASNAVQRAAYGHILSRTEAEAYALQQLQTEGVENPDEAQVRQMTEQFLNSQYQAVQAKLFSQGSDGADWKAIDNGTAVPAKEYRDALIMADQDWLDPSSQPGQGQKGPLLMPGQNWNAPMLTPEQQQGGNNNPGLPDQAALLDAGGSVPGQSEEPPRRRLGIDYESDAATPAGRMIDTVNQVVGTAPTPPAGPGSSTANPYDQEAVATRQQYYDRAQQAIESIGGNRVGQFFRTQSDESASQNQQLISFLTNEGMDYLGTDPQMWALFESDPFGFIDVAQRLGQRATPEAIASQIRPQTSPGASR